MNAFSRLMQGSRDFFSRHRGITLVVIVLAFVLPEAGVYFHRPSRGADIFGYIRAGEDALRLRDLYAGSSFAHNNTWPPFFSLFAVPLALSNRYLGSAWTREWWLFLNLFCFFLTVRIWNLLLTGTKPRLFSRDPSVSDCTTPLVFLPVVFVIPGLVNNFFMLQINTLILFLVSAGFLLFRRGSPFRAGALLGLAASLKATPALAVPYFLVRRRWKVAGWTALCGAFFTVLPALVYGWGEYFDMIGGWLRISFPAEAVVGWGGCNDQSFLAMWERYLAHLGGLVEPGSPVIAATARLSSASLLVAAAAMFLRRPYGDPPSAPAVEFAAVCILMVLCSPIAWRHYWVMLYPASAVTFVFLRKNPVLFRRGTVETRLMVAWVTLLMVPYLSRGGAARLFKALSFHTWSAVILLVLLLVIHGKRISSAFAFSSRRGSPRPTAGPCREAGKAPTPPAGEAGTDCTGRAS